MLENYIIIFTILILLAYYDKLYIEDNVTLIFDDTVITHVNCLNKKSQKYILRFVIKKFGDTNISITRMLCIVHLYSLKALFNGY